jgi:single-strand DNA-binding protein
MVADVLAVRHRRRGATMAASNINRVVLTGNLTRDPELRSLPSGMSVCSLRLAVNTRRKGASGDWEDKPNYFDVTVWGAQGENCARYLAKGRPVALDGRLEWREWETPDGNKRQAVDIVADTVQFLGGRDDTGGGGGGGGFTPRSDIPPRANHGRPRRAGLSRPARRARPPAPRAPGRRRARRAR